MRIFLSKLFGGSVLGVSHIYRDGDLNIYIKDGSLNIEGTSLPENSGDVYNPVIEKMEEMLSKGKKYDINVSLDEFNVSSSAHLMGLFHLYESDDSEGRRRINWYYRNGDKDMREAGEDYARRIKKNGNFEFNVIEKD